MGPGVFYPVTSRLERGLKTVLRDEDHPLITSVEHSSRMTTTEPFTQARDRIWAKLTDKEKTELSGLFSIQDVYKATAEIQAKQQATGEVVNTNKIRPYLDCLRQYAEVIEVFMQVKPEILALIWVCLFHEFFSFAILIYCTLGPH
jgi:hypothetical protein